MQCLQLSNQSGCLKEVPDATNRANTIFMTSLFAGGSIGTFCAGVAWESMGWLGVCIVGVAFALCSMATTLYGYIAHLMLLRRKSVVPPL